MITEPTTPKTGRRWLQFSLRTLLLLVLVACVGMGWFALEMRRARERQQAVEKIEELGGVVFFEEDHSGNTIRTAPAWLRKPIGEDLFFNVKEVDFRNRSLTDAGLRHLRGLGELQSLSLSDTQVTDAGLVQLESLTHLRELDLMRTSVTDAGLAHLQVLAELRSLVLANAKVTDDGLAYLRGLTQLQLLELHDTCVTDAGLVHLRGLSQLRELHLSHTQVTDAGLVHLRSLSRLELLELTDTLVTEAGAAELQKSLPFLGIVRCHPHHEFGGGSSPGPP